MKKTIIAHIPVIHGGYLKFFKRNSDCSTLYILGEDLISELSRKEIRSVDPFINKKFIQSLSIFKKIEVIDKRKAKKISKENIWENIFILPDEAISGLFIRRFIPYSNFILSPIFLRWDEKSVYKKKPVISEELAVTAEDRKFMLLAEREGEKSSDWWRRVGAVLVKDDKIILSSHNFHLPHQQTPYIDGDPRDFVEAGKDSYLASAVHSEQAVIAQAAKEGISLLGADIYVSVFPCPMCARLIALSGVKRCFFSSGHASLDGQEILRFFGVKMILISNPKE